MIHTIRKLISNPWPWIIVALIACAYTLPKIYFTPDLGHTTGWISITPSNNQASFNTQVITKMVDKYLNENVHIKAVIWQVGVERINGHVTFIDSDFDAAQNVLTQLPSVVKNISADSTALVDWTLNPQHNGSIHVTLFHLDNDLKIKKIADSLNQKWRSLPGVISTATTQSFLTRWIPANVEIGSVKAHLSIDQRIFLAPIQAPKANLLNANDQPNQTLLLNIDPAHYTQIITKIDQDLQALKHIDEHLSFSYNQFHTDQISKFFLVCLSIGLLLWLAMGFKTSCALLFIQLFTLCQACWIWGYHTQLTESIFCLWLTSFYMPTTLWASLTQRRQSNPQLLFSLVKAIKPKLPILIGITTMLALAAGSISSTMTLLPILSFVNSLVMVPVMAGALLRVEGITLKPPPGFFKTPSNTRKHLFLTVVISIIFVNVVHSQYTPTIAHRFIFKAPSNTSNEALSNIASTLLKVGQKSISASEMFTWTHSYFSPSQQGFYHPISNDNIIGLEVHLPWYASQDSLLSSLSSTIQSDLFELIPIQNCAQFPFCSKWLPMKNDTSWTKQRDDIQLVELPPSYIDGMNWNKSIELVTASESDRNVLVNALNNIDFNSLKSKWSLIKRQSLLDSEHFTLGDAFEWEHWIPVPDSRFYFKGQPLLSVNLLNSDVHYSSKSFASLDHLKQKLLPSEPDFTLIIFLIVLIVFAMRPQAYRQKIITMGCLITLTIVLNMRFIPINYPAWIFFTWAIALAIVSHPATSSKMYRATAIWTYISVIALMSLSTAWLADALIVLLIIPAGWLIKNQHCPTITYSRDSQLASNTIN